MPKKKVIKKKESKWDFSCDTKKKMDCSSGGCSYFLGFIGAFAYYLATTTGFWAGVVGFFKALVWPVFLMFHLMKFLGM